jgi:hypothetical protein
MSATVESGADATVENEATVRGNLRAVITRLVSRERQRLTRGAPLGRDRGSLDDLYQLSDDVTRYLAQLEITIVQPGLSGNRRATPSYTCLAALETYARVANAAVKVHCSP